MNDSSDNLKFRCDDLMGVLVWIQTPGEVQPDTHAAVMKFFGEHNPQAIEILRKATGQIQVGVIKMDKPKDQFENAALEAASKQAKKLDPCVFVLQQGSLKTDDLSVDCRYMLFSFFHGAKTMLVLPQPKTQIILE